MLKDIGYQDLVKIDKFIKSINSLIEGKYLLIEVKATEVMSAIESSEKIKEYINKCNSGFDFETEFTRAGANNSFNDGKFKMPSSDEGKVALVYNIIKDVKNREMDFQKFIVENFSDENKDDKYQKFAKVVLIPFRNLIAKQFEIDPVDNTDNFNKLEQSIRKNEYTKAAQDEKRKQVKKNLFEELISLKNDMVEVIESDFLIRKSKKEDMLFVLDSMEYAVKYQDLRLISSLLTSFRYLYIWNKSLNFIYNKMQKKILDFYEN